MFVIYTSFIKSYTYFTLYIYLVSAHWKFLRGGAGYNRKFEFSRNLTVKQKKKILRDS